MSWTKPELKKLPQKDEMQKAQKKLREKTLCDL